MPANLFMILKNWSKLQESGQLTKKNHFGIKSPFFLISKVLFLEAIFALWPLCFVITARCHFDFGYLNLKEKSYGLFKQCSPI